MKLLKSKKNYTKKYTGRKCRNFLMRGGAIVVTVALILTSVNLSVYANTDEEVKTETNEQLLSEQIEQISEETVQSDNSTTDNTENQNSEEIAEQSDIGNENTKDDQQNLQEILSDEEFENISDEESVEKQDSTEIETGSEVAETGSEDIESETEDTEVETVDTEAETINIETETEDTETETEDTESETEDAETDGENSEEEVDEAEALELEEELIPMIKSSNTRMLLGASPNGEAEYIPLKCLLLNYDSNMNILKTAYQNLDIPYQITSQSTKYKWECTFSHLQKTYNDRCGSIVGIYNGNRSGYLYSAKNTTYFQVCVGSKHFGTEYYLYNTNKNTVTAEYDGANHTFSIKDTLNIIGSTSGTWEGSYALNKQFNLTSCATYDSYADSRAEFVAMKFYELKIWEGDTLVVDMIPVKMKSGDTWVPGVYDVVSGKFQDKPSFGTSNFAFEENTTKIIFDNQGATTSGTTELMVSPGTTLMTITPPAKTGCTFDGYYTGTNGTGTKYYDSTGRSLTTWASADNGTLYAKWIHNHSFKYAVDGSKIYAYCDNAANNDQCAYYASDAATAKTKSGIPTVEIQVNGGAYTGSAYTASTMQTNDFTSVTETTIGSISYKKKDGTALSEAPKDAGEYTASVTVASNTISKDFTISKIDQNGVTTVMSDYTYGQTPSTPSIAGAKETPSVTYYYSTQNQSSGGTEWKDMTGQTLGYGTYYMYAELEATTNYNEFTTPAVPFSVGKATRDVSASVSDWIFGRSGAVPQPCLSVTLTDDPEIKYYYNTIDSTTDGTEWSTITDTKSLDAGDYYVYATVGETDNYEAFTTGTSAFKVEKAACIVTAPTGNSDLKYTGEPQFLLATPGSVDGGEIVYCDTETGTYVSILPTGTEAKTYTVWYMGKADGNHTDSTPQKLEVTIAKAPCEVTAPIANNLTYTGEAQILATAGSAVGGEIVYCDTETGTYTDTIPSGTDAGTYSVWYKGIGDADHEDADPQKIDVTIDKAVCVYMAPGAKSLKYDGTAQVLLEAGTTSQGTFYYSFKENEGYSTDIPTAIKGGNYTVWYKIVGDNNHKDVDPQSIPVTIGKSDRDEIVVSMSDYTYEQEEAIPTPVTSKTSEELHENPKIKLFYNTTDSNEGGTEWKNMKSTSLNAGEYYMYAVVEETDSYRGYTTGTKQFTVNKSINYVVTPPIGRLTYGMTLAEATLEGGSAAKTGDFTWEREDIKPEVADSEITVYDIVFTPSGDDAVNYAPLSLPTKAIVTQKTAKAEISNIKVDDAGNVTETITETGKPLVEGRDYEKTVVKEPEKPDDTSTNYTVTYTFKGNYTGTVTKKVSIPKGQKPGDNIISTTQSDPQAEKDYKPELKPVSYEDVRKVINEEIGKMAKESSGEQKEKAQAIVEKISAGAEDEIVYDAELSVEMKVLDNDVPAEDENGIKKEAGNIPDVSEDIRYVDISVYLTYTAQIGEDDSTKITQSKKQIHDMSGVDVKETITLEIPTELCVVPSEYERTYYVIRAHKNDDGSMETTIIAQTKSTTVTITSDKFSTFAIAYADTLKPTPRKSESKGIPFGWFDWFGSDSNDDIESTSTSTQSTVVQSAVAAPVAMAAAPAVEIGGRVISPKTADTLEVVVFMAMFAVGVVILLGSRKRKKHSEQ